MRNQTSTEASELHGIISAGVQDMLDAYRTQAQAGPMTDKALVLALYFFPTLQIHSTRTRLFSRLEKRADRLVFKHGLQRGLADAALEGAHTCVNLVLEDQNQCFGLGLDEDELYRDFAHSWPRRGKDQETKGDV